MSDTACKHVVCVETCRFRDAFYMLFAQALSRGPCLASAPAATGTGRRRARHVVWRGVSGLRGDAPPRRSRSLDEHAAPGAAAQAGGRRLRRRGQGHHGTGSNGSRAGPGSRGASRQAGKQPLSQQLAFLAVQILTPRMRNHMALISAAGLEANGPADAPKRVASARLSTDY